MRDRDIESMLCMCNVHCTIVYNVYYTYYIVHCIVQYTLYGVQCTVYTAQRERNRERERERERERVRALERERDRSTSDVF